MTENKYQADLSKKIKERFPGCVILKQDANLLQGILDWVILFDGFWASLEVKMSADAPKQPNQDYYIQRLDEMSFAAYIYPENEDEVLDALQQAFSSSRRTRVSQS